MFKLSQQDAKLTSVNPRSELHGESTQLACDLKFVTTLSNNKLDEFHPELRKTLFKRGDPEKMDLADQASDGEDYLNTPKFPDMKTIPYAYKGLGYRVIVHNGFSDQSNINLINAQVDKYKFELLEGGSVKIEFRVIAHPTPEELGNLSRFIQNNVDITLEPPTPEQRAKLDIDNARGEIDEEEEEESDEAA